MKSVVLSGSQRYKHEIKAFARRLRELGAPIVLEPDFNHDDGLIHKDEHERMQSQEYRDQLPAVINRHFDYIRKADVFFVYNKNAYLGVNTTLELGFAHGKNMIIYAFEPEPIENGGEICRHLLFTDVVKTPEELIKRLA